MWDSTEDGTKQCTVVWRSFAPLCGAHKLLVLCHLGWWRPAWIGILGTKVWLSWRPSGHPCQGVCWTAWTRAICTSERVVNSLPTQGNRAEVGRLSWVIKCWRFSNQLDSSKFPAGRDSCCWPAALEETQQGMGERWASLEDLVWNLVKWGWCREWPSSFDKCLDMEIGTSLNSTDGSLGVGIHGGVWYSWGENW